MPLYDLPSVSWISDAAATTFAPPEMPAHATGDLLLFVVLFDGTPASALTATAGWTVLDSGASSDGVRMAVVRKEAASGSETAPTFTSPATSNWGVAAHFFRGAHATPIDSYAWNNAIAASTSHTSPALTPTNDGCGLVYAFGSDIAGNARAYLNPNELVPGQIMAPGATSCLMTGTSRQETADAVPTCTAMQDQSQGGQSLVIAIRSADGTNHMQAPPGGVTMIRFFSEYDGFTASAPSALMATMNGITCHTAAPTGAEASASAIKLWGRGSTWTGTTTANAGYWEGPTFTGVSLDLSTGPIALAFQVGSVATNRMGVDGVVVVLQSSAGNWKAYKLRRRADMAAGIPYIRIFDPSTATVYASAGTVDLTSITGYGVWVQRSTVSNTTANTLTLANFVKLTTAKLIGGGTANPLKFGLIPTQAMYYYGAFGWGVQNGSQYTLVSSVDVGDLSIATYITHESLALQYQSNDLTYDVGNGRVGITIKSVATGSIDFDSGQMVGTTRPFFTINASASNPGFSVAGLSMIGFAPTWKSGFDVTGMTFSGCGEVDGKGADFTGCTFTGSYSTAEALSLDPGGDVIDCAFTKGAETYAINYPTAGTNSVAGTTWSGYGSNEINASAASGTLTLNLDATQTAPDYVSGGVTVSLVRPTVYFVGADYADDTRYQLSHQQVFDVASSAISTVNDTITLGNDSNGDAQAFSIATSGYHTICLLTLADGATMPTTVPQIYDGGRYRVKTNASGVITLCVTEGGTTINFTSAGTNNGSGDLFTLTAETDVAHGVVSGGSGISVAILRATGARIRRKAIHYKEVAGATVTSVLFDDIFLWSSTANTSDPSVILNTANPWAVPNQIGEIASVALASPVKNASGVIVTSVTPQNAGSAVTGLTFLLEGDGKIQLNSADVDGVVVGFDLGVWIPYVCSTAAGIWIADSTTLETTDLYNFKVQNMEVDETSGTFTQFVGVYIDGMSASSATTGNVALNVATRGNGAQIAPVVSVTVDPLAPTVTQIRQEMDSNSTKLADILTDTAAIDLRLPSDPADQSAVEAAISAIPAAPSAATVADAVWDEAYAGHTTAGTFGKLMDILRKANLSFDGVVTANSTASSFDTDLGEPTGAHDHQLIMFTTGALTGYSRPILTFTNGAGNTITMQEDLPSAPGIGDEFVILAQHVHPISEIKAGLALETTAQSILADTAAIDGRLPSDPADQSVVDAAISAIPTNPLLTNDVRLDFLDAPVSTAGGASLVDIEASAVLAKEATSGAIKAKTDKLTFTTGNNVDANIQYVNDVQVKGTGTDLDPWNPA